MIFLFILKNNVLMKIEMHPFITLEAQVIDSLVCCRSMMEEKRDVTQASPPGLHWKGEMFWQVLLISGRILHFCSGSERNSILASRCFSLTQILRCKTLAGQSCIVTLVLPDLNMLPSCSCIQSIKPRGMLTQESEKGQACTSAGSDRAHVSNTKPAAWVHSAHVNLYEIEHCSCCYSTFIHAIHNPRHIRSVAWS